MTKEIKKLLTEVSKSNTGLSKKAKTILDNYNDEKRLILIDYIAALVSVNTTDEEAIKLVKKYYDKKFDGVMKKELSDTIDFYFASSEAVKEIVIEFLKLGRKVKELEND